ncbi:MAG: hypothetical protein ACRC9V_11075 [Aeromonas sp.]
MNLTFLTSLDNDLLILIMLPDADRYPLEDFENRVLQAIGSEFCVRVADGDLSDQYHKWGGRSDSPWYHDSLLTKPGCRASRWRAGRTPPRYSGLSASELHMVSGISASEPCSVSEHPLKIQLLAAFDPFYFKEDLRAQPEDHSRDLMDYSAPELPGPSVDET